MSRKNIAIAIVCLGAGLLPAADWLTDGYDVKRTNWQRDEKILSPTTVKDMKLIWSMKLDNQPKVMHALFPPLIVNSLNVKGQMREVAIVAGVDDNIFAIDVQKGEQIWRKHFENTNPPAPGGRGGGIL